MRSTRLEFLLELVGDAYLTANRTRYVLSSKQETTPLDHTSPTTTRSQAAGNDSRLCRARNTQNPLCGKTNSSLVLLILSSLDSINIPKYLMLFISFLNLVWEDQGSNIALGNV